MASNSCLVNNVGITNRLGRLVDLSTTDPRRVVRTEIHARVSGYPVRPDRAAPRIPLGRPADPDEIAAPIAWLLREEASYVTGAVLRVAGGRWCGAAAPNER